MNIGKENRGTPEERQKREAEERGRRKNPAVPFEIAVGIVAITLNANKVGGVSAGKEEGRPARCAKRAD